MTTAKKHIMIIAGEASGDMHAAHLIEEIKRLRSDITFSGLGGSKMQQAGVELYHDLTRMAVVGFIEVLKHYKDIKKIFHFILNKVREIRPHAVILVDYPGFNLRLARELKKMNVHPVIKIGHPRAENFSNGVKVVYYISPQVWAWKENRVYGIKECVDKMLVLFQFEKEFYARFGVDVQFVGHPLIDAVKVGTSREAFLEAHGLQRDKLTIGILPGSRQKEVETLLPVMLKAADLLSKDFPKIQFLITKAPSLKKELFDNLIIKSPLSPKIVEDQTYDGINACDLCMVASGTATLETAILQKPMIVIYKTSFLTWLIAKQFVKIPDVGLVNVVAGKRIVPECVQFQATGGRIAQELKNIFTNELKIAEIKSELKKVKESLGTTGASRRAAEEILKILCD